jgi:hypothetical protein
MTGVKDSLHGAAASQQSDSYTNQVFKFSGDQAAESDSGEDWDYGEEEETEPKQSATTGTTEDNNIDLMAFINHMDVSQM